MARRKLSQRDTRKLARVGSGKSYAVTLPIDAIRNFGWQEGQNVTMEVDETNKEIIIKDWKE